MKRLTGGPNQHWDFPGNRPAPLAAKSIYLPGWLNAVAAGSITLSQHTSNREEGRARLVCGGAGKGRSNCGFAGAPLDLIEKSLFSFLADAELIRRLLTTKSSRPCKLDTLRRDLAEAEKQAARIAELILGDDEAPKLLYDRLKLQEARSRRLRNEIDAQTMRLRSEAPGLETYESLREALANESNNIPHRPELRGH